jgi:hypothetical protein
VRYIEKASVFELRWIHDDKIREFVHVALSNLPDYFYETAASSTGKYHPPYALGVGGLVRHTKAAVAIAKDLLGLEMYSKYSAEEKDLIIASMILHDGMKHGVQGGAYTAPTHPTDCATWLSTAIDQEHYLSQEQFGKIHSCISSHMGQWNTDYKSKKEILPKPVSAMEKFVHQCDYLASRKYLEVNFDSINYEGDRV